MKRIFPLSIIILLAVIFCNDIVLAQDTPPVTEFPVGAFFSNYRVNRYNPALYDTFSASGMNWAYQYINNDTKQLLNSHNINNVVGGNNDGPNELIKHYGSSHYSKWEAEENQTVTGLVGVKHKYGNTAIWENRLCWSSGGLTSPKDSLMYGPHYYQEKIYHRYYFDTLTYQSPEDLKYIPRFSMALSKNPAVADTEVVCVIKVVHRYIKFTMITPNIYDSIPEEYILRMDTLRVSRFNSDSSFKHIYFEELLDNWYRYDPKFKPDYGKMMRDNAQQDSVIYRDILLNTGIQFCVDWLRSDTLCTLFIDNVEVYDENGWERFLTAPDTVATQIKNYAIAQASNFPNLKYFEGGTEQASIDCIVPQRTVDSLVRVATGGKSLWLGLTIPYWTLFNGVNLYKKMIDELRPEVMLLSHVTFYPNTPTPDLLEELRRKCQETHTVYRGFWNIPQSCGDRILGGEWKDLRKPDPSELKASVMLSLVHGVKGLMFWQFESEVFDSVYKDAIIDSDLNPTELYYVIKDNLVPRLKGKLGNTLLGLNYTGNFINFQVGQPEGMLYHEDYLSLVKGTEQVSYHAGLLQQKYDDNNKYFLVTNLLTNSDQTRYCTMYINYNRTLSDFTNWRIKNVEGVFDETFLVNNHLMLSDTLQPGEGHLFQVAPVIKFGGKLIVNETAGNGMTLYDAMTIENGATLTVNGTYNINADITVKDGGQLIPQPGANLVFNNGAKLIVNGGLTAVGTAQNKITFDFASQQSGNGIVTDGEDFLTVTNCIIKNAVTGLNVMHRSRGTAQVKYSRFENCESGISLVNCTSALILGNEFINTELGIFTSNVSDLNIVSNQITTSYSEFPAIFLNSSTGYIRKNTISGYQSGIEFGNSSPFLGANNIHHNRGNGLLIGPGSVPDLQGLWIRVPCTSVPIYSPLVGMNNIYENGGMTSEEWDNGSEVYIDYSSILLENGCNTIADDREELKPPYTTMHLFSGVMADENPIVAGGNEWGYNAYYSIEERFDNLPVYYEPIGCVLPDNSIDCEFIVYTTENIPIDTFYTAYVTGDEENDLKELYAEAESYFTAEQYDQAKQIYNQIISGYNDKKESLLAFTRLLIIERLQNGTPQSYETLKNFYSTSLGDITDTVMIKVLNQLISLSLMNGGKLTDAANSFQDVIDNNPGTEEAAFAELDIYTTALLDTSNTLNKGGFEKVTASSFNEKLSNFMRKRYGRSNSKTEQVILPKEYSLYQNYPNPFNPSTTIKFDLPKDGNIELIVYDILGRKITQLVNEYRSAGSYEHRFDASNLASGIYLYQLKSGEFVSTKKMLMIK